MDYIYNTKTKDQTMYGALTLTITLWYTKDFQQPPKASESWGFLVRKRVGGGSPKSPYERESGASGGQTLYNAG